MIERRAFLAVGGTVVGIVGGLVAAASGAPVAGILATLGALAAGTAFLLERPDLLGGHHAGSAPSTSPGPVPTPAPALAFAEPTAPAATSSVATAAAPADVDEARPGSASAVDASSSRLYGDPPASDSASTETAPESATHDPAPGASDKVPVLTDPITGLFSEDYFEIAIEARLAAARRHLRPVGVVLLDVVEGLRVDNVRPTDPQRVADAVRATLREADTASRREDGRFALLLEDTPENGAIWTVERIRRRLVDADASLTVWAGVACYPAHAFDKASIVDAAERALEAAREWRQDRIEVAPGD